MASSPMTGCRVRGGLEAMTVVVVVEMILRKFRQ